MTPPLKPAQHHTLSDNDFGKAEIGRRIGHVSASDNAARIIIRRSTKRQEDIEMIVHPGNWVAGTACEEGIAITTVYSGSLRIRRRLYAIALKEKMT